MGAVTIQQMADRVAELMQERLHVRGQGLSEKLRKGGRLLPRKVRQAGLDLAQAAEMAQNPKLLLQLDEEKIAGHYDVCLRHLAGLNLWDRRKGALIAMTTSILFILVAVGVLVLGVLMWRGYL